MPGLWLVDGKGGPVNECEENKAVDMTLIYMAVLCWGEGFCRSFRSGNFLGEAQ
jgi:hypothetical protein